MRGLTFQIQSTAALFGGPVVKPNPELRVPAPNPLRAQLFRKPEAADRRPSARYTFRTEAVR
ncbi:MAG TPA: hypothetical protein VMJ73_16750 [Rhizomicrobium sp.]|nr:hypothetical protein [Rhizomicrobium sp.]